MRLAKMPFGTMDGRQGQSFTHMSGATRYCGSIHRVW